MKPFYLRAVAGGLLNPPADAEGVLLLAATQLRKVGDLDRAPWHVERLEIRKAEIAVRSGVG